MLRKSLLSMISDSLLKRNKCIVNVACHSVLSRRSTHADSEEPENATMKKLNNKIEKVKLNTTKAGSKLTSGDEKYDLIEYLADNLSSEIINMCLNVSRKMDRCGRNLLCLVDSRVAAEFVSIIIDDLSRDTCFVAELNPGIGMLTTELLKADIPLIHLYEERKEFDSILKNLSDSYPGRLDQRRFNLFKINTLMYLDKITNRDNMVKVFQGVKSKRWEDICMQMIGATSNTTFMRHIIYSLLFRNSFMTYGRTVFYMAIPPTMWNVSICLFLFYPVTCIL